MIPTYNRACYLGAAIRSVLDQTFTDFELLVVDDGSTDDTAGLVGAFRDARLRYLSRPHRGIGATLNAGLGAARGRYIARLDSDDLWLPDMLATLVPALDAAPDTGVVYARAQAMDPEGLPLTPTLGVPGRFPGESLASLVYDDCTCSVALLARRECFDGAGPYDETLLAHEDWDMCLRVARHCRFVFVDRVVARVRSHAGSLTSTSSPHFAAIMDTRTAPLDKLFLSPDLPQAVIALKAVAYANVHMSRGRRWLQQGEFKRGVGEFSRAVGRSDRPATTLFRIAWLNLAAPLIQRSALGRRAVWALADLRRRRRAARRQENPNNSVKTP